MNLIRSSIKLTMTNNRDEPHIYQVIPSPGGNKQLKHGHSEYSNSCYKDLSSTNSFYCCSTSSREWKSTSLSSFHPSPRTSWKLGYLYGQSLTNLKAYLTRLHVKAYFTQARLVSNDHQIHCRLFPNTRSSFAMILLFTYTLHWLIWHILYKMYSFVCQLQTHRHQFSLTTTCSSRR